MAPKCEIAALQDNQHLYKITSTWMTNTLWLQMSGAIAGGLVGSCAGFLANIIRARLEFRRHRHSVASALEGVLWSSWLAIPAWE